MIISKMDNDTKSDANAEINKYEPTRSLQNLKRKNTKHPKTKVYNIKVNIVRHKLNLVFDDEGPYRVSLEYLFDTKNFIVHTTDVNIQPFTFTSNTYKPRHNYTVARMIT
jgi:hypothetical protein